MRPCPTCKTSLSYDQIVSAWPSGRSSNGYGKNIVCPKCHDKWCFNGFVFFLIHGLTFVIIGISMKYFGISIDHFMRFSIQDSNLFYFGILSILTLFCTFRICPLFKST